MKKIFTLTAIMSFLLISNSYAQITYGAAAGFNRSTWKGDAAGGFENLLDLSKGMVTATPVNGFYAGGFADIPLTGPLSIRPGLYYSQKGYAMSGNVEGKNLDFLGAGARARIQSHYISMPVVLKANIAEGLFIYGGPQLSYLVNNTLKVDAGLLGVSLYRKNFDITDQFSQTDVSLTGGAGYTFNNGMTVSAGYDHGLSRLDKNQQLRSYNRSFNIGLGITF